MFYFDGRGRASTLTLTAVVLATACAGSVPIGAPAFLPGPAMQTQPEMQKPTTPEMQKQSTPQTRKQSTPETRKKTPPARPRSKPAEPKRTRPPALRDSAAMELAVTREYAHGPLALALARRTGNPQMADRAASAVVREAERLRLSPSLLAAVLLIENAPLDSVAVSHQGAIGMMQVMPVHLGSFGCAADLVNVESNICHGARLLKHLVRRTGSVPLALKRYNGCVRGRNTPSCSRYPVRVLRTASRLRREVLVSAAGSSLAMQEALSSLVERPASVPSQPVTAPDTVAAPAGTVEAHCATLMGCLRYRWSLTN